MKILVIKLRHHGDVLLSSPVFSVLKARYPEAHIDAYIYKETYPMLAGHPAIDGFILYDKKTKSLIGEIKRLWYIRKEKYDLAINLTEGDRGALAVRASRAKTRAGFHPEGSGIKGKEKWFTHLAKICPHPRHTVERNLDVLRAMQIFPEIHERELTYHIPDHDRLSALQLVGTGQFILIHPVSRWLFKCLPEKTVATVIDHLHAKGYRIVMSASPDPKELAMLETILTYTSAPVLNLGGKLNLKELGALIDMSELLVTVDSVPLHIASALKAPVVAIFGPTSEINWAPYRNLAAKVVTEPLSCRPCYRPGCGDSGVSDCLVTMPARKILDAIEQSLRRGKHRAPHHNLLAHQ